MKMIGHQIDQKKPSTSTGFMRKIADWNEKYPNCVRDYWRGADSMLADLSQIFSRLKCTLI
jgi:hypothetical protein